MTPNPTFRAAREAVDKIMALSPEEFLTNRPAYLISERFRKLCTAAKAVMDELENGYPGYDQYSADVQEHTAAALREALKEVL